MGVVWDPARLCDSVVEIGITVDRGEEGRVEMGTW